MNVWTWDLVCDEGPGVPLSLPQSEDEEDPAAIPVFLPLAAPLIGFVLSLCLLFGVFSLTNHPLTCCCGPNLLPTLLQSEAPSVRLSPLVCPNPL